MRHGLFLEVSQNCAELLADTEFLLGDDSAVTVDVFAHEVVEKATTFAYKHFKSAFGCMIFVV